MCQDLAAYVYVEVSCVRVFQSALKIGGGTMAGGAHGTIAEVGSSLC
jgi:hypothetical protein